MYKARILLVEDESIEALDIKNTLESFNYNVIYIATRGDEAVAKTRELNPDIVLMDIVLKGEMDGITAAKEIKNLNIPIIYLTAHSEDSTIQKAKLTEPYGYLIKPFDPKELGYTIELALYKNKMEKSLKESEERYRMLFKNSQVSTAITSMDGKVLTANNKFFKMVGATPDDINKIDLKSMYQDINQRKTILERLKKGEKVREFEIDLMRLDGKKYTNSINVDLISYQDEQAMLVTAIDISARKESEKKLENIRLKFQRLFDNAQDLIYRMSLPDGNYEYMSPSSETIFEKKPEKFYEQPGLHWEMIHPDFYDYFKTNWEKLLQGNMPSYYEYKIITPSGKEKWINQRNTLLKDKQGNPIAIEGIATDVTLAKLTEEELIQSQFKLEAIFDSMRDALIIMDKAGKFYKINDAAVEFHRFNNHEEFYEYLKDYYNLFELRNPDGELMPIEEWPANRAFQGEELRDFEVNLTRKDTGESWDGIYNSTPVYNEYGELLFIVFIIQDITDRKLLEKERERFFNYSLDMMCIAGFDGYFKQLNPSWSKNLGWTVEELKSKPYMDFIHPDDRESSIQAAQNLSLGQNVIEFENRYLCKDGSYRWLSWKSYPFTPENLIFGVARDITESKRSKLLLQNSEERFRSIINNSTDLIRILDMNGLIIFDSPSSERILGYPRGFFLGKSPLDFIHPDDRKRVDKDLSEVYDNKNPGNPTEFRILKADGEYLSVESVAQNFMDVPSVNGVVITTHPIKERKSLENALLQSLYEKEITNQVVTQLVKIIDAEEVYSIIEKAVEELMPQSYIIISATDPNMEYFHIVKASRLEEHLDKLKYILGSSFYDIKFPLESISSEELLRYQSGKLHESEDGIYNLTIGKIPKTICKFIEKVFKIGKVYGIGFSWKGVNYGSLTIILPIDNDIEHKEAIENIVNQASIAIQRSRADTILKESLAEKEVLLREIHHRVKNNMQIVSSLLNLQAMHVDAPESRNVLKESQGRVKSMAMIHEKLYQSPSFTDINFKNYTEKLTKDILYTYGLQSNNIEIILKMVDINLNIDTAIPLGLIVNELVTNSLKYAFPDQNGKITISVNTKDGMGELIISDDGIGIPDNIDVKNTSTLGLQLVNSLVLQLDGKIKVDRSAGTCFKISFIELEYTDRIQAP